MATRRLIFSKSRQYAFLIACLLAPSYLRAEPIIPLDQPAIEVHPDHDAAATGKTSLTDFVRAGKRLFRTVFNQADGVGRPTATGNSKPTLRAPQSPFSNRVAGPDASSCADCHNQPMTGGSGGAASNVFVGAHRSDPPADRIRCKATNERNTISVFRCRSDEIAGL